MDSNDQQDDVPLARLLKKGLFSTVEPTVANVLVTPAHFNKSSSPEDIFVPSSGQPSTTNKEIGQFRSVHQLMFNNPFLILTL
ncbi:uncharacterized protein E5676_scaffold610G00060 [Cucumis melo var. makuwa]|uniref:Uncharacterized protein n=1 Tax=Cucumis melo var. makuwa TaxID=1194695 RepID=A0A5D3DKB7_CUCMM|nr:uncharacterized protein E6C27_scaffold278G00030 [Cucumis melo var. makuwa]TYK24111.1 uncharacterized protein E5676_scaffold610G00060 [Cucumis melo var. makuwa]